MPATLLNARAADSYVSPMQLKPVVDELNQASSSGELTQTLKAAGIPGLTCECSGRVRGAHHLVRLRLCERQACMRHALVSASHRAPNPNPHTSSRPSSLAAPAATLLDATTGTLTFAASPPAPPAPLNATTGASGGTSSNTTIIIAVVAGVVGLLVIGVTIGVCMISRRK